MNEEVKFILAFIGGMLWYRILFYIAPLYFKRPLTRTILKLKWHHLHWGILLVLLGTISLLALGGITTVPVVLLGIGLGFMMDLFIPSLLLSTDREEELKIYKESLLPTLLLFAVVVAIILALR